MKKYITPALMSTEQTAFVPALAGVASVAAAATLVGIAQELMTGDNLHLDRQHNASFKKYLTEVRD